MRLGLHVLVVGASAIALLALSCSSDEASDGSSADTFSGTSGGTSGTSGGTSGSSGTSGEAPGTHTDGIKNLDETDVDCGGADAKKCEIGKGCKTGSDCTSATCNYAGKCIDAADKSCVLHHGGDTCGPANAQESCCKRIAVGNVQVDKYKITAGRFRAFVEAVNGDIRGFVTSAKPQGWQATWNNLVPTKLDDGQYVSHEGVYQELGPGLHAAQAGGNQGCTIESYGARTFHVPDAVSKQLWNETNHYTQDELDEKMLNCVTFYMLTAFCAWDAPGGRLVSLAEFNQAWGNATYPWGASPMPQGYSDSFNNAQEASGTKPAGTGDKVHANYWYNWWSPSERVCGNGWCDYSVHIAPPGRFPQGNGSLGHADLAGIGMEITSTFNGNQIRWSKSGSWQGHAIPFGNTTGYNPLYKYWATGGRCAH